MSLGILIAVVVLILAILALLGVALPAQLVWICIGLLALAIITGVVVFGTGPWGRRA